jgi:hypothetical protein
VGAVFCCKGMTVAELQGEKMMVTLHPNGDAV